jgi:hypothetical protein
MLLIAHFQVLGYRVYILIEKERHVQSYKLIARVEVRILVRYEEVYIYQVYIPS